MQDAKAALIEFGERLRSHTSVPRCPKCGSKELELGVVQGRVRILCPKCPEAFFFLTVQGISEFFTPVQEEP